MVIKLLQISALYIYLIFETSKIQPSPPRLGLSALPGKLSSGNPGPWPKTKYLTAARLPEIVLSC